MAIVEVEGNEIPMGDDICADDKSLKAALLPFYPAVENASIKRNKDGDTLRITVTKKAGSKGIFEPVFDALNAAPEEISPILAIEVTGWKNASKTAIDMALLQMLDDEKRLNRMTTSLDQATIQPAKTVPSGF